MTKIQVPKEKRKVSMDEEYIIEIKNTVFINNKTTFF